MAAKECQAPSPAMHLILRQLEPLPAAVLNARMDILGYNQTFERLFEAVSPEFQAMWRQHDVAPMENLTKRFNHPQVGILSLDYTNLWFGPRGETRLTTYTPSDEDS